MTDSAIIFMLAFTGAIALFGLAALGDELIAARNRRKREPDAVQRQARAIVRAARQYGAEWIWEAK
jgi:predicted membrane-bound mannosyltransferase